MRRLLLNLKQFAMLYANGGIRLEGGKSAAEGYVDNMITILLITCEASFNKAFDSIFQYKFHKAYDGSCRDKGKKHP